MSETSIKVRIDDNEALQALREMAGLVDQIAGGLGGLTVPPGAIPPQASQTPSGTPDTTGDPSDRGHRERTTRLREILKAETRATVDTLTNPASMGHISQRFGSMLTNISKTMPFGTGVLASVAGAAFKATSQSLQARQARLADVMGLELQEAEIAGIIDSSDVQKFSEDRAKNLTPLGFDSSSTRSLIAGVAGAVGFKSGESDFSTGNLLSLAAAERSGMSAGAIASLAGAIVQNTGVGVGQALERSNALKNIAQNDLDLRGPGVDRFLGGVNSILEGLTAQGIMEGDVAKSIASVAARTGQRGQRPAQIVQGLQGIGRGAFNAISSPFQGLAQSALMAQIYAESGSVFEAMQKTEQMIATPETIPSSIAQGLGGQGATLALASIPGLGTRDAQRLVSNRALVSAGQTRGGRNFMVSGASLNLNAAQARQTTQTLQSLRDPKSVETFKKMIEFTGRSERNLLKMSENIDAIIKVTDIALSIQNELAGAVNSFNSILNKLSRMIP